ncbi:hypothetical protein [Sphaerisporangium perillae]|uniref:hypothetical protein n=1 Tax=Sphaerisporangium perillae TaxID=2935860 RepID=UPI00200C58C2|nr:hypothetical protein [Sphaerisporangium perillae]
MALSALVVLLTVGVGALVGMMLAKPSPAENAAGTGNSDTIAVTEAELKKAVLEHGNAYQTGDLKGYLKIFDQKNAALVKAQTRTFANLRKLPLQSASFEILKQQGLAQDNFGRQVSFSLDVAFVHQFAGIDLRPVAEWYRWTVTKASKDAPLVVTKVGGAPAAFGEDKTVFYPAPWDSWPDISVTKTLHTIVLAPPAQAARARQIAPVAERAAAEDLDFWAKNGDGSAEVPAGFVVALAKGRAQLGHLFRTVEKVTESGVSIGMPTFGGSGDKVKIGGSRIVVDTASPFFDDAKGVREIFRHEMAHSVMAPLDNGEFEVLGGDNWIIEGFAEFMAHRGESLNANGRTPQTRAYVRGQLDQPFTGKIPDNLSWDAEGLTSVNYQLGHLAIQLIAERYGEERMTAFVAAYYRDKKADTALQDVLGVSRQEFERQWAQYVRGKLG